MVQQIYYELDNDFIILDLEDIEKITIETANQINMIILNDKKHMMF